MTAFSRAVVVVVVVRIVCFSVVVVIVIIVIVGKGLAAVPGFPFTEPVLDVQHICDVDLLLEKRKERAACQSKCEDVHGIAQVALAYMPEDVITESLFMPLLVSLSTTGATWAQQRELYRTEKHTIVFGSLEVDVILI